MGESEAVGAGVGIPMAVGDEVMDRVDGSRNWPAQSPGAPDAVSETAHTERPVV